MSKQSVNYFGECDNEDVFIPISSFLTSIVTSVATKTAWINLLVMIIIIIQVVLRYGFHSGAAWVDELIWHFYAFFMFGLAYAITTDSHIRVDIAHMHFSKKKQRIFEVLGILLLIMPFTIIIFDHSVDWVLTSFRVNEFSENPTGLPYRWIVKTILPLSMILLFIASLSELIKNSVLIIHSNTTTNKVFSNNDSNTLLRLFQPSIKNSKGA